MTAPGPEVQELAAAVAEVLDIPLPEVYTTRTMEQHRKVLMERACHVQCHVEDIAEDRSPRTLAELVAFIREAVDRFPIEYATDRPAEEAS